MFVWMRKNFFFFFFFVVHLKFYQKFQGSTFVKVKKNLYGEYAFHNPQGLFSGT